MVFNASGLLLALTALYTDPSLIGFEGQIDAYIIPNGDQHNSEYIADFDKRRDFISNFTGSAGTAIVPRVGKGLLWTDGRYFTQAGFELDFTEWSLMRDGEPETLSIADWLASEDGVQIVGVDPKLYTKGNWDALQSALSLVSKNLVPIQQNLIDIVWDREDPDRVKRHESNVILHENAGENVTSKLGRIREEMKANKADVLIVSELDQIAWTLNLRGSDIPQNPVFFSYLIITGARIELFADVNAGSRQRIQSHLTQEVGVGNWQIYGYEEILDRTEFYNNGTEISRIWVSKHVNYAIASSISDSKRLANKLTPIAYFKLIKNDVEVEGMRNGHLKDAVAVVQFLHWIENEMAKNEIGHLTELSVSDELIKFRSLQDGFAGTSFTTIAGSGPNGAIIHYKPTPASDRPLSRSEMFLLDSGGQYSEGATTDVTRTLHFGSPRPKEIEAFTRVLKGQIGLRTTLFPEKTPGNRLDSIARRALWEIGLDYLHGTGHGIGSFLHVHEPPIGISYRPFPDDQGLLPNMFLSNEPGYYEEAPESDPEGGFGIRLENIVQVVVKETPYNFNNRSYLTFEDVTLVPIQRKLINPDLLTSREVEYLDSYHRLVREKIGNELERQKGRDQMKEHDLGAVQVWLVENTMPLRAFANHLGPNFTFISILFIIVTLFNKN